MHRRGGKARNGAGRHEAAAADRADSPAVISLPSAAPIIKASHGVFDLDAPHLPPIDCSALARRHDELQTRDAMFAATDGPSAAWTVVLCDDKGPARLGIIHQVLSTIEYAGKDELAVRRPDASIVGGREPIGSR